MPTCRAMAAIFTPWPCKSRIIIRSPSFFIAAPPPTRRAMPDFWNLTLSGARPGQGQREEAGNFQMSLLGHFTPPSTLAHMAHRYPSSASISSSRLTTREMAQRSGCPHLKLRAMTSESAPSRHRLPRRTDQTLHVLEQVHACHQPRRQARPPLLVIEPAKRFVEARPVDQSGQLHQRVLYIDHVVELAAEQLVTARRWLFRRHRQTPSCRPAH